MDLLDFSKGTPWSIVPEYLSAFESKVNSQAFDKKLLAKFEDQKPSTDFALSGGVARIPIHGPVTKRSTFFSWLFGGVTLDRLSSTFKEALEDPDVEAIVLDIDSPGGTIGGVEAFSDLVFAARQKKPIVAFAGGMMASAAYWFGSAANYIIAEKTAEIGSIGVLMIHYDLSKRDEKLGMKRTFLTAGHYKALGNDAEPLSEEATEVFKSELDHLYGVFFGHCSAKQGGLY